MTIRRDRTFIPNRVLTVAEVAKYLRMSRPLVYRLARAHKIPAFKIATLFAIQPRAHR